MRARILAVVSVVLLAGTFHPHGAAARAPKDSGRLIVAFHDGTTARAAENAHDAVGARVERQLDGINAYIVEVDSMRAALASYRMRVDVRYAEPDATVRALAIPQDDLFSSQWNLWQPTAGGGPASANWEPAYPDVQGDGVLVAIVDTGVRAGGADQPVNLRRELGYDFANSDPDATDDNGHGTHLAGTIAQRTGNVGLAGSRSAAGIAPRAGIIPVKVLDAEGSGSVANTIAGILHAASRGARVINLSLGGGYSRALCDAVAAASSTALIVAASGNDSSGGLSPVDYPAACPGALAVGAARYDGTRAPYSNGSCETGLVAPGGDLGDGRLFPRGDPRNGIVQESFDPATGRFGFFYDSGTSIAAAHVAGAAALLLQLTPDLAMVARALKATARDLGAPGPDDTFGYGALDIGSAVAAVRSGGVPAQRDRLGYWMVGSDGGMFTFGDATFHGSTGAIELNSPIVGMARTATGSGYWLVAADGGVFSFGDASFFGSTGGSRLNRPIVGMARTATGKGYWLVGADGGIFAFGDAGFHGSTGAQRLAAPIAGMVASRSGTGYWLFGTDGAVFAFGAAAAHGSRAGTPLAAPIVAMAATPTGGGYWLVGADGGVFTFGDARFLGAANALPLNSPVVGIASTCAGDGYWLVAADGGVFSFGDGRFLGSTAGIALNRPIVAVATAIDHRR